MIRRALCVLAVASLVVFLSTGQAPAALVGQWSLDDGSGTVALDSTANNYDQALQNTPTWITTGLAPVPSGTTSALQFNGSDEFGVANGTPAGSTAYPGVTGANPRSVSAWIKTTKNDAAIVNWGANSTGQKWTFRVQTSNGTAGALRVEVNGGFQVGNTDLRDGNWHHVVAVLPSAAGTPNVDQIRLYVDGELEGISATQAQAINTGGTQNVRIGRDYNGSRYFNGPIDEVRIYDHGLSSAEVRALAGVTDNYGDAVLADGAVGYWRLGEDTGAKAFNEGSLLAAGDAAYSAVTNANKGVPGLVFSSTNTAVNFDGGTAEVHIPSHASINTSAAATTKSFELIFKADDVTSRQVLYEQGGAGNGFNLYVRAGELYFGTWTGAGFHSADTVESALDILAGETYHVVGTWDGDDLRLYVQGELIETTAATLFSSVPAHTGRVAIGGVDNDTRFDNGTAADGNNFDGIIDDVSIYNTVLTPDQVLLHAQLGVGVPEPATMTLLGLAACGLGGYIRKRRHA